MEKTFGVLMTLPRTPYLEQELEKRFKLFRLWESAEKKEFIAENSGAIRAMVVNTVVGADAETIEMLPKLEIVSTLSVGLDAVDLVKCKERGIRVTNTPGVLSDCVADVAIGLILATMRKISACDRYVRAGLWKKQDYELTSKFSGKSVGIVGLGRIGSAIAKRAEAFGCPISYYSRTEKPESKFKFLSNIIDLATSVDVLVVACPLTEASHHIINREVIQALGPKGVLVNIGRGQLVDEPELVSALLQGRLAGAGLDVFEHEPEVPEQLFELDNVVLLPHVASDTQETLKAMADLVIANLEAYVQKKPLVTPVV